MKSLLLLTLAILCCPAARAAGNSTCSPNDSSRWKEASIAPLEDAAQVLLHVRATGIYLAADLLCGIESCVGFVNGIKATGNLQRAADSNQVTGFTITSASPNSKAQFNCESL